MYYYINTHAVDNELQFRALCVFLLKTLTAYSLYELVMEYKQQTTTKSN